MLVKITWARSIAVLTALGSLAYGSAQLLLASTQNHINDLNNQIKSYEKSSSWKLPETLNQLNSVSSKIQKQLATNEEFSKLKAENIELTAKQESLATQLRTAAQQNQALTAKNISISRELKILLAQAEKLELAEGESAPLIKNKITLGIANVFSNSVHGSVGNKSFALDIGKSRDISFMDVNCSLTLTKIIRPKARFEFLCDDL